MDYDAVIIGAGMSGLAAGIRLAHFDRRVLIVERHYAFGGLNSYYTLDGRQFDVGLHAVTNYVAGGHRGAPLSRLLRQLRLTHEDFDLRPQRQSETRGPHGGLRFANGTGLLEREVAERFPHEVNGFRRLLRVVAEHDDTRLDGAFESARRVLDAHLRDPCLIDLLLCPVMYYGCATEHDMDFTQFVTIFKSIFCEGFARPPNGVRTIITALVKRYRACGGRIRMRCGVDALDVRDGRVGSIRLESGETIFADVVISSAGYHETMQLCSDTATTTPSAEVGRMSFVESLFVLDTQPARLGFDKTIVFYNDSDRFRYAVPDGLFDQRSGVICCPNNYVGHEAMSDRLLRITWLADYHRWAELNLDAYTAAKQECGDRALGLLERFAPGVREHVVATDVFTPTTVRRYTGHINGAVYGAPHKRRDGRTHLENLFICGTDQGFLGIIGAMLSGISMANLHVLSET